MMKETDRLVAISDIQALKARYFRLMDTKLWEEWGKVFAVDAVMDMRGETAGMKSLGFAVDDTIEWVWRGRDKIVSTVSQALMGVTTVHHGHMGEITVHSPQEASGVWAMEDMLRYGAGAPVPGFHGYGHYHETYVRTAEGWQIKSIKLTRLLLKPDRA